MQDEIKARFKSIGFNTVLLIIEQYLKELFILLHMIITNISPNLFAFIMIVIASIIISILNYNKNND